MKRKKIYYVRKRNGKNILMPKIFKKNIKFSQK